MSKTYLNSPKGTTTDPVIVGEESFGIVSPFPHAESNTSQDWIFQRFYFRLLYNGFVKLDIILFLDVSTKQKDLSIMQMVIYSPHSPYLDIFTFQQEHFAHMPSLAAVTLRIIFHHTNLLLCIVKLWLALLVFSTLISPFSLISPFDHHLL